MSDSCPVWEFGVRPDGSAVQLFEPHDLTRLAVEVGQHRLQSVQIAHPVARGYVVMHYFIQDGQPKAFWETFALASRLLGVEDRSYVLNEPDEWPSVFGPEDVFGYIYAVLHSPEYRTRYAEFLKVDFPRVPITSDVRLFWQLVSIGRQLVDAHLLKNVDANALLVTVEGDGDNRVEKPYPLYDPWRWRVQLNAGQYVWSVWPEVWNFRIGGYQVAEKWLKDRRGRTLTAEDLAHYCKTIAALKETIALMRCLDEVIPAWPFV